MRRFWPPKRADSVEAEMDKEIAFHLEQATAAYVEQGLSPAAARRRAHIDFGGREQVKQNLREVHVWALLASLGFYARAALRFVRHAPGFSVAAVLTLALGIGANTAVFSAVDAVLLRPLPYPHGDRLMLVAQRNARNQDANRFVAPARLEDWNRLATATFDEITGYYKDDFTETSGPLPERLTGEYVAPRFLQVMGVGPMLGRNFLPKEEHFGGPSAALISYGLWQRRFNGDPKVLGKNLHVGRTPLVIVGVMPASFAFPGSEVDLWTPSAPDAPYARSRDSTWFTVIGRLRTGITVAQGAVNLATVQRQLGSLFPKPDADLRTEVTPLKETVVGSVRGSVWLLYGAVSVLLLIACSNLAALLLARTADREHEISIRFSLGASRAAIITQLLAEVFALAALGSVLGLVIAGVALHGFHLLGRILPRVDEVTLNWRVLLYSVVCAGLTTMLCGVYPALRGTRRELAQSLAAGGRTQVGSRGISQWVLVGVQVMLAVVLLTGAGLLLRSLQALGRVSPGFDPTHVLTFEVSGSWGETADRGRLEQRISRTLEGLRTLPGVEAAATTAFLPGLPGMYEQEFQIDHRSDAGRPILADDRFVSEGYFATIHLPVLEGEACKRGLGQGELVNRSFVSRYFGTQPALGHELSSAVGGFRAAGQITGIVADAREAGLNADPVPTVYFCSNAPSASPHYLVRTRGDAMSMAEAVRRKLHELEPARSVFSIMSLEQQLDGASAEGRVRTLLLLAFAAAAMVLACIGLYGTLSYLGQVRQREIGLRLTLGASRAHVAMRFLVQGLRITLLGCAAGAVLSAVVSKVLTSMLYGVSALDVPTYAGVLLFVLSAATVACAIPARRAAAVEPVQALRGS